uniref:non-specific serine/threonine protein kinase n=1 Tax=Wollemia nobilis TaxID=56998 RepID=A0A0C9S8N7_9CONI
MDLLLLFIVVALIVGILVLVVWLSKTSKMHNDEEWKPDDKILGKMPNDERKPGDNIPDSLVGLRTFTREKLAKATNDFTDIIGEGGFGAVYRANLEGNRTVAVKRATKTRIRDQKLFEEELSVLLRIRHPYLVSLIGFCFEREEQCLVFEFVPQGNLYDRLHTKKGVANPLPWASRVHIAFQVAEALEYLHEKPKPPVLHRDIKSSNVLLVDDNNAKLADFGLSRLGPKKDETTFTTPQGSYGYMDPEYAIEGKLSLKSDVYSFGVLLLELVTGLQSLQGTMTLAESIKSQRLSEDTTVIMGIVDSSIRANVDSKQVENIITIANRCLAATGELRPHMSEIVTAMKNNVRVP